MKPPFLIDKQTLKELNLSEQRDTSVFDFFNHTTTDGGHTYLKDLFYSPTSDIATLKERQKCIRKYLNTNRDEFVLDKLVVKDLEEYVTTPHTGNISLLNSLNIFRLNTPEYFYTVRSIKELRTLLITVNSFIDTLPRDESILAIKGLLIKAFVGIFNEKEIKSQAFKVNLLNVDKYDRLIRFEFVNDIKKIFKFIYETDAYLSIVKTYNAKCLVFPEVCPKNTLNSIKFTGLYNIFHSDPIKNDVYLREERKIWFLTGSNMAGKSSIIKAIATAVYLTHIGFPIPANSLKMDVLDGLFTSINIEDDISRGYSHYYSEAMRLKNILDQVSPVTSALIILDELFKGTNYSDASEGTLSIIKYLAKTDKLFVIITSHIMELYKDLKTIDNIAFHKLNVSMDGDMVPQFTYVLSEGVSEERLGMWLLEKSGVFSSCKNIISK